MTLSYLHLVISTILLIAGIVLLYKESIKRRRASYELTQDGIKTTSIAFVIFYLGVTSFFDAIKNYPAESIKKESISNQYTTVTNSYGLNSTIITPVKKRLKVVSNLSPSINKLIADKLNKWVSNNTVDHLNLKFSWPKESLKVYVGGKELEYWSGEKVRVTGSCGDFPIDSDYIQKEDKYPPEIVKNHLRSEVNRIVKKHIDQVCNKLKQCLDEEQ